MGVALADDGDAGSLSGVIDENSAQRFGGYVIHRQIGAGGMGVVYQAVQVRTQRKVAIKLIRDDHLASPLQFSRFSVEADAIARLDHPNIVRVLEIGEADGHPFFSMDLIDGESLGTKLAEPMSPFGWKTPAPPDVCRARLERIARLVGATASAVHHAHERGVLHRDLKPANILIDNAGEPHLTDFGLAKILRPEGVKETLVLTTPGNFLGTPSYMAPEQVSGREATRASDIYALGAVLYELLVGHPPFRGPTPFEILKQILESQPLPPRSLNRAVPVDLQTICLNCLEKNPAQRYISAAALAEDLQNWLAGRPIKARPRNWFDRMVNWVRRNRAGAALIASLCVGLLVALSLLKVVKDQRDEINRDRNQAFEEGLNRIRLLWDDPNQKDVGVSARELAILGGRSPARLPQASRPLCFAVSTEGDPASVAQGFAGFLGELQGEVNKALSRPVVFNLKLLKLSTAAPTALADGRADLMMLSPVEYLSLAQTEPRITLLAKDKSVREAVLFVLASNRVDNLAQLRGRSMAFPDPDLSISVWARARLVGAGLRRSDFRFCTNILDQRSEAGHLVVSPLETVHRVLARQADAGITYRPLFERYKHLGIIIVDRFQETPDLLAAKAGLDPEIALAVANVIQTFKSTTVFDGQSLNLPSAMVPAAEADLTPLRQALRQAALFDAHPTREIHEAH